MIRVDAVWLAVQPLDMRLGTEAALAREEVSRALGKHGSQVGEQALRFYQALFRIERQAEQLTSDERRRFRQRKS